MIRKIAAIAGLTLIWIALWGDLSWANVASGVVVSVLLVLLFPAGGDARHQVRPIRALRYGAFFAGQLLVATWQVVLAAVAPAGRVAPGILAVPLRASSDLLVTVVGNSVSLTPGTLSVDVVDGPRTELIVHALDLSDPAAIRRSVWRFEELAVAAFGTDDDRAAILAPSATDPSAGGSA
jgi:multicomponent Na+:H+ antiporter subunit E